jgi:hypothetical protein
LDVDPLGRLPWLAVGVNAVALACETIGSS